MNSDAALRLVLVDDEALARLRLRSLLAEIQDPATRVVAEAQDAAAAERVVSEGGIDLVLLDIGLPGPGGLTLARRLASLPQAPAIVFVTAHAEHALTAFELEAVDYLTKPVSRERLQAALRRVAQRRGLSTAELPADAAVLIVNDRGRLLRLPLAELLYLKAELKYVTVRTAERSYVLDDALSDLEQRLGDAFLRVHRNALVARRAVRELARRAEPEAESEGGEGWAVRVAPADEWLAVSRRQLAAVRQALAAPD